MPRTDLHAAVTTRLNLRERLLAEYPALIADDHALNDTLSGIDDLEEQIVAMLRLAVEREAMAGALGDLMADMNERKQRLLTGAKSMRAAALHAMQDAGLKTIAALTAPDMTVSIGRGKPKVIVTAPDQVPVEYCRVTREPNKTEIGKALGAGTDVPGAVLGNPVPFLSIHRG